MEELKEFTFSEKVGLRRELKKKRADLADKQSRSVDACLTVNSLVRGNVMVYASIGGELSTDVLIDKLLSRSDVNVFVPHTDTDGRIKIRALKQTGEADRWGNLPDDCILPTDGKISLDYCITPLLGFNRNGYRIGYGRGCYDRFFRGLSERSEHCVKIGLAFDCQLCDFAPQPFDVPLDCCVTESNVIYF